MLIISYHQDHFHLFFRTHQDVSFASLSFYGRVYHDKRYSLRCTGSSFYLLPSQHTSSTALDLQQTP